MATLLLRYPLRRPMLGATISKLLVVLCLFQPLTTRGGGGGVTLAFSPHATRTSTHNREHGRYRWVTAGISRGGCLWVGNNNHAPFCLEDGASFPLVSAGHPSPRRNLHLTFMTSIGGGGCGGDNDDKHPDNSSSSSSDDMLFGEAGLLVALSVVATTLGVATLYSLSTNPLIDFDVDLYLSINRALTSGSIGGGGGAADGVMGGGEIVELPALSPAEQIVGAFFGPPGR